jgi:hypothetical protein
MMIAIECKGHVVTVTCTKSKLRSSKYDATALRSNGFAGSTKALE